jgi:hypothetical protein
MRGKDRIRWKQSLKVNLLFGALALLMVVGVFLLNGIVAILTNRYSLSYDLTENAAYQIGPETAELLADLQEPVEIFVLSAEDAFGGSTYLNQAKRVIQQYPRYSSQVALTFVDYASDPSFAAGFPDLALSGGDLIVRCGSRTKHISVNNLFHYTYTASGSLTPQASRAEEAVSSAILNVTTGELVKIAVLTGNGVTEARLFTALLSDNNYQLTPVNLTTDPLEGYDGALLFSPSVDLSGDVLRKLEAFLYNGGQYGKTLFYTASPAQAVLPNLDAFLAEWGIAFSGGAVFETVPDRTYQYQPFYPLAAYAEGRYRDMLRDANTPFLMPLSRPMNLLFTAKDGYYVEELLTFAETSGVRPAEAGEDFSADGAELDSRPALALSSFNAEGADGSPLRSMIIASASTGIFDTMALQNTSVTNSEYLLSLLGDLTGQTAGVTIEPKALSGKVLGLTSGQVTTLGWLLPGVLPLCILILGVAVWLWRRYK